MLPLRNSSTAHELQKNSAVGLWRHIMTANSVCVWRHTKRAHCIAPDICLANIKRMAWHGKLSSNYTLLLASATQSHSDLNDLQVRTAAAMHKADQMGNGSRDGTEQHLLSIGPACNTAISRKNTCVAFSCVAIEGSCKSDNAAVCATVLVISCIGCLLSSSSEVVFCRLLGTCTYMLQISMYKNF